MHSCDLYILLDFLPVVLEVLVALIALTIFTCHSKYLSIDVLAVVIFFQPLNLIGSGKELEVEFLVWIEGLSC